MRNNEEFIDETRERLTSSEASRHVTAARKARKAATLLTPMFKLSQQESETLSTLLQFFILSDVNKNTLAIAQLTDLGAVAVKAYIESKPRSKASKQLLDGNITDLPLSPELVMGALLIVSSQVQELLRDVDIDPQYTLSTKDPVDETLEHLGSNLSDELINRLTGVKHKTYNLLALSEVLAENLAIQESKLKVWEKYIKPVSGKVDAWNEELVAYLEKHAYSAYRKIRDVPTGRIRNRLIRAPVRAVQLALSLPAAFFSINSAKEITEDMTTAVNRKAGNEFAREIVNSLVGRTDSNGLIYDMVKQVRSRVSRIRQEYVINVPKIIKEQLGKGITKAHYAAATKVIGKTDLGTFTAQEAINLLTSRTTAKKIMEEQLAIIKRESNSPELFEKYMIDAEALAQFMTGNLTTRSLRRNAYAIADRVGEEVIENSTDELVEALNKWITARAFELNEPEDLALMREMAKANKEAVTLMINWQRLTADIDSARQGHNKTVLYNHYKGYVPLSPLDNVDIVLADTIEDHFELINKGYVKYTDYSPDRRDKEAVNWGYYIADNSLENTFNQGVLQAVIQTTAGVNNHNGMSSDDFTGMVITDAVAVTEITNEFDKPIRKGEEILLPVFNGDGDVVAYERTMNKEIMEYRLRRSDYAEILGEIRGRQHEEAMAEGINEELMHRIYTTWTNAGSPINTNGYINILSKEELSKSRVLEDAVMRMPLAARQKAQELFGAEDVLWVHRSMIENVTGSRKASVTDFWTGISRWDVATQKAVKTAIEDLFGKDVVKYLKRSEMGYESLISFAKTNIVVRSILVPIANIMGNVIHLSSIGAIGQLANIPRKVAELQKLQEWSKRKIDIEVAMHSTRSEKEKKRLENEIQSIKKGIESLSIAPLLKAGELAALNDLEDNRENLSAFFGNKTISRAEELVDAIPEPVKLIYRYGLMTKDTPLFRFMEATVTYGDFIAKALMYDHLVHTKGQDSAKVLHRITDAFVNYDISSGRDRGKLESLGIIWFWNYKLRSIKSAIDIMRHNPLHAILAHSAAPNVDTPLSDNLASQVVDGTVWNSLGLGMLFRGLTMSPAMTIVS